MTSGQGPIEEERVHLVLLNPERLDQSRKKGPRVPISLWLDGSCACTDITDKCLNCMLARTGHGGRETLFFEIGRSGGGVLVR